MNAPGKVKGSIRDVLGLENAFEGYELEKDRIDKRGWNSKHPFLEVALAQVKPSLVIELGVWKGMSSIHMAKLGRKMKLDLEILSIDTWLGSSNHLAVAGRREELSPQNGYPSLYRTFLANVKAMGLEDTIVPLPMDGNSAAYALRKLGVKAGVIHIDASHEYEAALADFRNYWDLLDDNGILICDDYGEWPEVTRAVCEFAAEKDRPVFASMRKALVPKDPTLAFETQVVKAVRYKR